MSDTNSEKPIDYTQGIDALPTMVEVVTIGALGILGVNLGLKVPGLGTGIAKMREWSHKPFQWIGGKEFTQNRHYMSIGDTGISFCLDMIIGLAVAALAGRTETGRKVFNSVNDFTERQCKRFTNLFGFGQSPA